jgi:hypothetical protein
VIIDPGNFLSRPGRDLVKVEEAEIVQDLFILWANAADSLELVGLAATGSRNAFRPLHLAGNCGEFSGFRGHGGCAMGRLRWRSSGWLGGFCTCFTKHQAQQVTKNAADKKSKEHPKDKFQKIM